MRTLFFLVLMTATLACGEFAPLDPVPVDLVEAGDGGPGSGPVGDRDGGSVSAPDASVRAPVSNFVPSAKAPSFVDDFDRPDDLSVVGNGWLPKTSTAFGMEGRAVKQQSAGGAGVRNLNLLRSADAVSDVEIAVTFTATTDNDDPSLLLRVGSGADVYGELEAYVFQARQGRITLSRYVGTTITTLVTGSLVEPLLATRDYRMVFRVWGTTDVGLVGAVIDTTDDYVLGSCFSNDMSAARLVTPGRVGFGSGLAAGSRWDDFTKTDL